MRICVGKNVASSSQQPYSGGYGRGNSPQQWDNRSQPRASTFEESRIPQGPTPRGNQGDDSRNAPQRGGQAWNQQPDRPEDFPQLGGKYCKPSMVNYGQHLDCLHIRITSHNLHTLLHTYLIDHLSV